MKILHISRTMGQGGAEKVVVQLCSLNKENDCQMVVASVGGKNQNKLKKLGIVHYTIPDIASKNPFDMINCFFAIFKIIIHEDIQIVHTHHRMAAFFVRLISLFIPSLIHVYTAHNVFKDKLLLTRFSIKKAKIIAVGEGVKENLVDYFKINANLVSVIYNSVYVPTTISDNLSSQRLIDLKQQGKCLVGCVGRLSYQKGIDIFIEACKVALKKQQNIVGIIVGDGEKRKELENLALNLGIEDSIIFLGYQTNIYNILKHLDFVVLSSRWEGLPLTPIEAFAMKKTVIASDISGNNEVVTNKKDGLLFKSEDFYELGKLISKLATTKTCQDKLGEAAYNTYLERYSYREFLDNYKKIYLDLAKM